MMLHVASARPSIQTRQHFRDASTETLVLQRQSFVVVKELGHVPTVKSSALAYKNL